MIYNNKDGEIIIKKCDKEPIITFIDENDYKVCERALRNFNMRTYKDLVFKVVKELKKPQEDGNYSIELYTDSTFKKVYGSIKLNYFVKNNVVVITGLSPSEILHNLHISLPKVYKGVPYTNEKEYLKIKIMLGE